VVVDQDYQGDMSRYVALMDDFPAFRDLHLGRAPGGERLVSLETGAHPLGLDLRRITA
jgi:hypothetical protein